MMKKLINGSSYAPRINNKRYGRRFRFIVCTIAIEGGTQAPNFELPTPEGKKVQLSDFKGKYVLIDFWASWCPDCRRISPNVEAIAKENQGKDLTVVAVSFDIDKEAWVKYINRNGAPINEVHVSELKKMKESAVAKAFGVQWIPSLYLLDKDGKVLLATVEVSKVEAMVKTLMK